MVTVTGENHDYVVTRQEPGPAGLAQTAEVDGLLGERSHYGGENPFSRAGGRPLRELINDRLLDALLEWSRDEAGGLRLTAEGSMLGELRGHGRSSCPAAGPGASM
jgi:hypothetical protein